MLLIVFESTIYKTLEEKMLIDGNLNSYVLENASIDQKSKFYDSIMNNIEGYSFQIQKPEFFNNRKKSTLYSSDNHSLKKNKATSKNITFEYSTLTKDIFIDHYGAFYTDMPIDDVELIATETSNKVSKNGKSSFPLIEIIYFNILVFIVIILATEIVYIIFTSFNLKIVGLKKSLGFSNFKTLEVLIKEILLTSIVSIFLVVAIRDFVLLLQNRLSFRYVISISIYFSVIFLFNSLLALSTLFCVKSITLKDMINNHSRLLLYYKFITFFKYALIVLLSLTVAKTWEQYQTYKK